jgi:hypothetical protein
MFGAPVCVVRCNHHILATGGSDETRQKEQPVEGIGLSLYGRDNVTSLAGSG